MAEAAAAAGDGDPVNADRPCIFGIPPTSKLFAALSNDKVSSIALAVDEDWTCTSRHRHVATSLHRGPCKNIANAKQLV